MNIMYGLEMAKQSLSAQQSALSTIGHNIANANTDGYSRQRVNFTTLPGYPTPARNSPRVSGQLGRGVDVSDVQRIRNQFLDDQYRSENSGSGYWDAKADALSRMEDLMNEPSDKGLSKTLDQFWESLEDLSTDPDSSAARSVVAERGVDVAETFNHLAKKLKSFRSDEKKEVEASEGKINNITEQIQEINKQIKKVETHGDAANDLYDQRDSLIDELSGIVNIDVDYETDEGAPAGAKGMATIRLADQEGNALKDTPALVNGKDRNKVDISFGDKADDGDGAILKVDGKKVDVANMTGSLKGHMEAYGSIKEDNDGNMMDQEGIYPEMLHNLNDLVKDFGNAFNEVHKEGSELNEDGTTENNFFEHVDSAEGITVNQDILDDHDKIAANIGETNNGKNASKLAEVLEDGSDVKENYQSLIADMGVDTQKANRMKDNSDTLKSQVENQRQATSGVSLDEEMSNMIKFQHAYNAAARSMTTVDEMLDRVINNMGLVGR